MRAAPIPIVFALAAVFPAACHHHPSGPPPPATPLGQLVAPYRSAVAPERVPIGAGRQRIVRALGRPDHVARVIGDQGEMLGWVWMYDDYHWSRAGMSRRVGSHDVYLDAAERFVGWRNVTPLPQSAISLDDRLQQAPWRRRSDGSYQLIEHRSATSHVRAASAAAPGQP